MLKKSEKYVAEKSLSVLEGFKGGSFEHTKTFFPQYVFNSFPNIHEKWILYQFKNFFAKICT